MKNKNEIGKLLINDDDIATVEFLHDTLAEQGLLSLSAPRLEKARKLIKKMNDAIHEAPKRRYFIVYVRIAGEKQDFGSKRVVTSRKMDMDLIREIEADIEWKQGVKATIINYKRIKP